MPAEGTRAALGLRMKRIRASKPMMSNAAPPAISTLLFCHQGIAGVEIGSTLVGALGLTAAGVDTGLVSAGLASAGLGGVAAADPGGVVATAGAVDSGALAAGADVAAAGAGAAGVVPGFAAPGFSLALISPQMSFAVSFGASLPDAASPGFTAGASAGFVSAGLASAGFAGAGATAATAAGLAAAAASSCLSLACNSAISFCLSVNRRLLSPSIFSRSLTRDFSSPTSCSRLASASLVRARSDATCALPVPLAAPGRSLELCLPLPAAGGTSARCEPPTAAVSLCVEAGAGSDFGAPVLATRVGLAIGALDAQAWFWSRTAAATAAALPPALISSAVGMRRMAPRLSALMLSR